jgi:hypothetical protein
LRTASLGVGLYGLELFLILAVTVLTVGVETMKAAFSRRQSRCDMIEAVWFGFESQFKT